MKIVTFIRPGKDDGYRIGSLISETEIVDLTHLISERDMSSAEVLKCFDLDLGFCDQARTSLESGTLPNVSLEDLILAAPVPRPGKIICIGLNYRDHAAESGMPIPISPIIFSKFSSCAIGPGKPIIIPQGS